MSMYSNDEVDIRAEEILVELERRLTKGTGSPWERSTSGAIGYGWILGPVGIDPWRCSVSIREKRTQYGYSSSRGTGRLYLKMGGESDHAMRGDKVKGGVDFDFVEEYMVAYALRELQIARDGEQGHIKRIYAQEVLEHILAHLGGFSRAGYTPRHVRTEENGDKWTLCTVHDPEKPTIQLTVNMRADGMAALVAVLEGYNFLNTVKE